MSNTTELRDHLQRCLPSLEGAWVTARGKYEAAFAKAVGAVVETENSRRWDCVWNGLRVELKKGQGHCWCDLVRYSEYVLGEPPDARTPVITLFLRYDGTTITEITGTTTEALVKALRLTRRSAEDLLRIALERPGRLNAQARMTFKELKGVADFHIKRPS